MYSRDFRESEELRVPPHYHGTAVARQRPEQPQEPTPMPPPVEERGEGQEASPSPDEIPVAAPAHREPPKREGSCGKGDPPLPAGDWIGSLLRKYLPGVESADLLLLGIALLLLNDGYEDSWLPLLLLVLIVVR